MFAPLSKLVFHFSIIRMCVSLYKYICIYAVYGTKKSDTDVHVPVLLVRAFIDADVY